MENENKKKITPPYLSVRRIEDVINLASTRNLNEVNVPLFKNYGFNETDAGLAVNLLKFINVIDDEGKPTDSMAKLRLKGDSGKKEFEKIFRLGYKKLFDVVDKPEGLASDELTNEFFAQYGLTPRVARAAVPAFLKLAEYAGLREEGSVATRKRNPNAEKQKPVASQKAKGAEVKVPEHRDLPKGLESISVAEGRMMLAIPKDLKDKLLDDVTLEEDWKILRKAIHDFADKYIPKSNA